MSYNADVFGSLRSYRYSKSDNRCIIPTISMIYQPKVVD